MAELRRDIKTTMNRLYFERRQVLFVQTGEHGEREPLGVRASHIEAELNAMSGGASAACAAGRPASGAIAR